MYVQFWYQVDFDLFVTVSDIGTLTCVWNQLMTGHSLPQLAFFLVSPGQSAKTPWFLLSALAWNKTHQPCEHNHNATEYFRGHSNNVSCLQLRDFYISMMFWFWEAAQIDRFPKSLSIDILLMWTMDLYSSQPWFFFLVFCLLFLFKVCRNCVESLWERPLFTPLILFLATWA